MGLFLSEIERLKQYFIIIVSYLFLICTLLIAIMAVLKNTKCHISQKCHNCNFTDQTLFLKKKKKKRKKFEVGVILKHTVRIVLYFDHNKIMSLTIMIKIN